MHNLGSVIKFEIVRAIKKPSFWLAAMAIPVFYAAMFGLGMLQGSQSKEQEEKTKNERFTFQITDEAKAVSPQIIESFGGKVSNDKDASVKEVESGKIDAYYFIPKDLDADKIQIYGKSTGNLLGTQKYGAVLKNMIEMSSQQSITKSELAAANGTYKTEEKFYKDGKQYEQIKEMIVPGVFLVLFYIIMGFFTGRMLTSTTEEKENRVTEMILTSITAKTLIIGKIISLIALAFLQLLAIIVPTLIGFFILKDKIGASDISAMLSGIHFSFWPIFTAVLIFASGFVMITGAVVAMGAAMPTAKDASQFLGVIVLLLMAPFFVLSSFLDPVPNMIVKALSIFPLTSPISLLLRNTLGTLSVTDAVIGIGLLIIFAIIATSLAIRIFQYGTISYGKRISLKAIFKKKK